MSIRYLRIVPVSLIMGTIFFLSHQPGANLHLPPLPSVDKLAHVVAYAVLAATAIYACPLECIQSKPRLAAFMIILFCFIYGVSDEFHQSFIPGRESSLLDLVADTTGAAIMVVLWYRYHGSGLSQVRAPSG